MQIEGHAEPENTYKFINSSNREVNHSCYNKLDELFCSSLGHGTYLGDAQNSVDKDYEDALKQSITSGINLIDTAINYRYQRSERIIGKTLLNLRNNDSGFQRDQIIIGSKGGFLAFDQNPPEDTKEYIQNTIIDPGIATFDEFGDQGHCLSPDFLDYQLSRSLNNLNLKTIDIYYVHNPEIRLQNTDHSKFYDLLEKAFTKLEQKVQENRIRRYGIATWNGFREESGKREYLDLTEIIERAERAGGKNHNFKVIQAPFSLGMPEILTRKNQEIQGKFLTLLEASEHYDISVMSSASLLQGKLSQNLPEEIRKSLQDYETDAERALQFSRSAPGVTSALVGMKNTQHVSENANLLKKNPINKKDFRDRFLEEPS